MYRNNMNTLTLPNEVRFIKFHMRHCAVINPIHAGKPSLHILDESQQFGEEHANPAIVWPETRCRSWLTANGFTFTGTGDLHKTGEVWKK